MPPRPRQDQTAVSASSGFQHGVNPNGAGREGSFLRDVYGDITPKRHALAGSAPMVVGDGVMVSRAGAAVDGMITDSGAMAMVAKIVSLMMTTILKNWPRDKECMKANANRVPIGPSDCKRGMYVWLSTVGPIPNERRSQGRAAPKLCKRPQGSRPAERSVEVSVHACSWPTRVRAIRWGIAREVPAGP